MHLTDVNTIDYLGIEKETHAVTLTLLDDLDWNDELKHLALLQAKLNRYFDFIESGEIYDRAMELFSREVPPSTPVKIKILAKYEPNEEGWRFLKYVENSAAEAGVGFSFKVVELDTPP